MNNEEMIGKYVGKTVLGVGAHPDDLELGVGGTLGLLARAGVKVVMAIVAVPNALEDRIEESKKAASLLGAAGIEFLYPDKTRRVEDIKTYELVGRLDDLIRKHDPAAVLSHAEANFHKDHVLVHNGVVAAQRLHFFDFFSFYPTSCHPVTVPFHPQAYVDISKTMDLKMAAINQHTTQFTCKGLGTDHYRDVAREYGRMVGVDYAEGLEVQRVKLN
jgi:N-acetylglucosamine malate deacetylase 1